MTLQGKFFHQSWYWDIMKDFPTEPVTVKGPMDKYLKPKPKPAPAAPFEEAPLPNPPPVPSSVNEINDKTHFIDGTVVEGQVVSPFVAPPSVKAPIFAQEWTILERKGLDGQTLDRWDIVVKGFGKYNGAKDAAATWGRLHTLSVGFLHEPYRPLFMKRVGYAELVDGKKSDDLKTDTPSLFVVRVPKATTPEKAEEVANTLKKALAEGAADDDKLPPKFIVESSVLVYLLLDRYVGHEEVHNPRHILKDYSLEETPFKVILGEWDDEQEQSVVESLTPLKVLSLEAYRQRNLVLSSTRALVQSGVGIDLGLEVTGDFFAHWYSEKLTFFKLDEAWVAIEPFSDHLPKDLEPEDLFTTVSKVFKGLKPGARPFASTLLNFSGTLDKAEKEELEEVWEAAAKALTDAQVAEWEMSKEE
jgi:hypothetical protein